MMDFNEIKIDGMSMMNLFRSSNFVSPLQPQIDQQNKFVKQVIRENDKNCRQLREALDKTANNTNKIDDGLKIVINNQNKCIEELKKQLEVDKQQLGILKNLFSSTEDGVAVEKEIMKLIRSQIDSSHPLWEYVKDKGGDIAVSGITASIPIMYNAVKKYLEMQASCIIQSVKGLD